MAGTEVKNTWFSTLEATSSTLSQDLKDAPAAAKALETLRIMIGVTTGTAGTLIVRGKTSLRVLAKVETTAVGYTDHPVGVYANRGSSSPNPIYHGMALQDAEAIEVVRSATNIVATVTAYGGIGT